MHLEVAARLRPYSHLPGTACVLPGSLYKLQIFPCLIQVYSLANFEPLLLKELHFELNGPIKDFTVQQDLEKGCINVWGHSLEGYFRYRLRAEEKGPGIELFVEKYPQDPIKITDEKKTHFVLVKDSLIVLSEKQVFKTYIPPSTERLSLGIHKSQDWELIKRRLDLKEVFPFWSRLGQIIPSTHSQNKGDRVYPFLEQCQEIIENKKIEALVPAFNNFFLAGFESLLSPRLRDTHYQGLLPDFSIKQDSLSPLLLLQEGAALIRKIFIQEETHLIHILPALPPQFHAGRFIHIKLKGGILHLEWTKKTIRRLMYYAEESQTLTFHFKHIKKFRLHESSQDKGKISYPNDPIETIKKCLYFFDNFN